MKCIRVLGVLAVSVLVLVNEKADADQITWIGGATGSNSNLWSDTNNWSTAAVPGAADDVLFTGGLGNFGSGTGLGGSTISLNSLTFDTLLSLNFTEGPLTFVGGNGLTKTLTASGTQTFLAGTGVTLGGLSNIWSVGGTGAVVINGLTAQSVPGSSLTKTGAGLLILGAATSNGQYTGTTSILAGTLQINHLAAMKGSAGVVLGDTSGAYQSYLKVQDQGAVVSGFNTALSVQSGSVGLSVLGADAGASAWNWGGPIALGKDLRLYAADPNSGPVLSGVISGPGGLVKTGSGLFVIAGGSTNTFSGTTTVNFGDLYLNKSNGARAVGGDVVVGNGVQVARLFLSGTGGAGSNQIGSASSLTVNTNSTWVLGNAAGGVLGAFPVNQTLQNLTVNGGTVVLTGSNYTGGGLNFTNGNFGNGALTITGDLTFTGGSTLILPNGTNPNVSYLGLGGRVLVTSGSNTLDNAAGLAIGLLGSTQHEFNIATGSSLTNNMAVNTNQIAKLTGAGGILKTGGGTLYLFAATNIAGNVARLPSDFSGGLKIQAGAVVFGGTNTLGSGTIELAGGELQAWAGANAGFSLTNRVTVTANSTWTGGNAGALYLNGITTINTNVTQVTIGPTLGSAGVFLNANNTGSFTILSTNFTFNVQPTAGSGLNLYVVNASNGFTVTGGGVVSFNTNNTNTLFGPITLSGNTAASFTAESFLGSTNNALILDGGILRNGANVTVARPVRFTASGGATVQTAGTLTFGGTTNQISGTGIFTAAGPVTIASSNNTNFTGSVVIGTPAGGGGALTINTALGLSGATAITINTNGALILGSTNALGSATINIWGTNTYSKSGATSGMVTVNAGGELIYGTTQSAADGAISVSAGGILAGTATNLGSMTRGGRLTLNADAIVAYGNPTVINTNIQNLGAAADLFFGLSGAANTTNLAIGTGTPWKGIASDKGNRTWTSGTITLNSPAILKGFNNGVTSASLSLAGVRIAGSGGPYAVDLQNLVTFSNSNANYAGVSQFNVKDGAVVTFTTMSGMGAIPFVVEGGGKLVAANSFAIDGKLTLQDGSVLEITTNAGQGLNGTGTITRSASSDQVTFQLDGVAALTGDPQFTPDFIHAGDIVRLNAPTTNIILSLELVNPGATFVMMNTDRIFTALANFNINGGVITNDATTRTIIQAFSGTNPAVPSVNAMMIGSNGATLAATSTNGGQSTLNTVFGSGSNAVGAAIKSAAGTIYIGSTNTMDGLAKAGIVSFGMSTLPSAANGGAILDVRAGTLAGAASSSNANIFNDASIILRHGTTWALGAQTLVTPGTNRLLTVNYGDTAVLATSSNGSLVLANSNTLQGGGTLVLDCLGGGFTIGTAANGGYNPNFSGQLVIRSAGSPAMANFYSSPQGSPLGSSILVLAGGATNNNPFVSFYGATGEAIANTLTIQTNSTINIDGRNAANNGDVMTLAGIVNVGPAVVTIQSSHTPAAVFGQVNLMGDTTFNVATVGAPVSVGALNDQGTDFTLTKTGLGVLKVTASAVNFGAGSTFNVLAGTVTVTAPTVVGNGSVNVLKVATVNANAANAFNGAKVSLNDEGAVVNINAAQSAVAQLLVNAGTVNFNENAVTVGNASVTAGAQINAAGAGSLTVTGTLSGGGQITGRTFIAAGGTLGPGLPPSTLYTESLSLDPASFLVFDLGAPNVVGSGVNDLVAASGSLVLNGSLSVHDAGGFDVGVYRLFNYSGTLTGSGISSITLPGGFAGMIDTSTQGQVNLDVTPVPEPASLVLMGLGGLLILSENRKIRRRAA